MCAVSNIGDNYRDTSPYRNREWIDPLGPLPTLPGVSQIEFDNLKKEMEALKKLLKAAKVYDEETGQSDCEMDEKVEFIKKMAKFLDVDLEGIFDGN